ncbi:GTP 3',8-cyclase MoaA [Fulvivirgaceae bacterium BMA10]|uniref:GTP 3',8-cyclase n=1 Tax=Splendidivirga corallicola TaxID=3051826 RepID=A0ABT8L078_9BACT|nr:GTP 3',8-cyclase MoaA [Fulvivirgaceae bacterium BMA10]
MLASQVFDNHGRPINYVRLAVTDRCNLRCFYCMPEHGINFLPRKELLSYEEMIRILKILASLGVNKVRITGGEPFAKRDLIKFLAQVCETDGIDKIRITTNGVLTAPYIADLKALGITNINLSLDTLNRDRFKSMTRRDEFHKVWETFELMLQQDFSVKMNCVVIEDKNTQDIIPMAKLTGQYPVDIRFIEEMPFNGNGNTRAKLNWDYAKIRDVLQAQYPNLHPVESGPHSTSMNYEIPGHLGTIGIIAAYSRTFCGSCNRIRITSQGALNTCLYGGSVMNIKDQLRSGASDEMVRDTFLKVFRQRAKDGFEAEQARADGSPATESMSTIGG